MLPGVVAEAARRFGDLPAFVDPGGRRLSYRDLHRQSDQVAAGLARRGVGEGDVVALTLPSTTAYALAYLGAARLGAVTAGINPRLAPGEQQRCLAHLDPALVVADPGEVAELAGVGDTRPPPLAPDPDRTVAVVFTSGTTGTPQGAVFTNRQLAAITRIDTGGSWGDGTPTPLLAATQLAHVGFMTKLAWYLRLGTTVHLLRRWRAADVLDLVEREQLGSLGGVSAQIALLLAEPDLDRRDLSSVRTLVVGGGPSPPALVSEARQRFGAAYSIRYSSTESGGVGTGTAFDAPDNEALHTVGRPRPGVEVAIRDGSGQPLGRDTVGEVWLRSGAVMADYWHDPDATAATLVDGWLRTGDLGRIDGGGRLVLAGRRDDVFIRGGYNVHPAEVEAVLAQHPLVAQVAVVPRPDPVMGEVGVAVVVPADAQQPLTLAGLRAVSGPGLARHKWPEALVMARQLPLTAMDKVDRRALATLVADRAGDGGPGSKLDR